MSKTLFEAVVEMVNSNITTCDTCGRICEHGWDASTIITANGFKTVCSECDPRLKQEESNA